MEGSMEETVPTLELPGFRFHPTEEELLGFYLKNFIYGKKIHPDVIGLLNIYRHDPWDLPGLSKIGEREWYFFVPRDRKYGNGGRPNRTTEHGFWKATGSDRKVVSLSDPKRVIGLRKTLVFYQGRAPTGTRTDWVMNEYRLSDNDPLPLKKDIVLCKIYRKATSLKELEERAAKEETAEKSMLASYPTSPLSSSNANGTSFFFGSSGGTDQLEDLVPPISTSHVNITDDFVTLKREDNNCKFGATNTINLPFPLGELQVPDMTMDWAQDSHWTQSCSPWLANLLNFYSPTFLSQFLST